MFVYVLLKFAGRITTGKSTALLVCIAQTNNEAAGVVLAVGRAKTAVNLEGLFSPEPSKSTNDISPQPKKANQKDRFETPCAKKKTAKQTPYSPHVLEENELLSLLEECSVLEVSVSGETNTKCWECGVCSGTNPPSARRCMQEGCGTVREGGLKEAKRR